METLSIQGSTGTCSLMLGDSIKNLPTYIKNRPGVLVLDSAVRECVDLDLFDLHIIELEGGETVKNLRTVETLYRFFLESDLDKSGIVIALGGGALCDVVGFAAATYMRGIPCAFVPTTLLSQVDASIGGKNGVNLQGFKNLVGTIQQPEFVLIDTDFLRGLSENELRSGLAEIIKHAIIADEELFHFLEKSSSEIIKLSKEPLEWMIARALKVKAQIVNADERERSERLKLNLGHTLGHAIEVIEKLPHGFAISIGMILDCELAVQRKLLSKFDLDRIKNLLSLYELPLSFSADPYELIAAMRRDKKKRQTTIRLALPRTIGSVEVYEIPTRELEALVSEVANGNLQKVV